MQIHILVMCEIGRVALSRKVALEVGEGVAVAAGAEEVLVGLA